MRSIHGMGLLVGWLLPIDAGTTQSKLVSLLAILVLLALSRYAFRAMKFLGERHWLLEFLGSLVWVLLTFSFAYVCVLVFVT
jgi:hypothetical protein